VKSPAGPRVVSQCPACQISPVLNRSPKTAARPKIPLVPKLEVGNEMAKGWQRGHRVQVGSGWRKVDSVWSSSAGSRCHDEKTAPRKGASPWPRHPADEPYPDYSNHFHAHPEHGT